MCGFYCVAFTEFMIAGETLLDYTNLFSPNDYQKNDRWYTSTLKLRKEKVSLDIWWNEKLPFRWNKT